MKQGFNLYLAVGLGGMIGSLLRYGISLLFENHLSWGTLLVNVSGAFLLTFLLYSPIMIRNIQPILLTALTTGVIGSYTTFSTIQLETVLLMKTNILHAVLYISFTVIFGLFFSYLGYQTANRWHIGRSDCS